MSDSCTQALIQDAQQRLHQQPSAQALLILDDSFSMTDFPAVGLAEQLTIISNRIDHIAPLKALGFNATFADFTHTLAKASLDFVFYRISKERMVSHHCLNMATELLKPGAKLCIIGRKEDGIKNYKDKLVKTLGFSGSLQKNKDTYSASLTSPTRAPSIANSATTTNTPVASATNTAALPKLDDGDYHKIRPITAIEIGNHHFTLHSKPGVYGWKKLDQGSLFFVDTLLPLFIQQTQSDSALALDLGCGSGHLSLALAAFGFKAIYATDNNAAAIAATQTTLTSNQINAHVQASDCGDTLNQHFDLIVCNPPFHKGFDTHAPLTLKFVQACKRLLKRDGKAYFVVNAFIGIEKLLQSHDLSAQCIANNKQFKIICAQRK